MCVDCKRRTPASLITFTTDNDMLSEVDGIAKSFQSGMSRTAVLRGLIPRGLRARAAERGKENMWPVPTSDIIATRCSARALNT